MTANTFETAPPLTMGTTGLAAASSHVAMIKRFCEFALMTVLFTVFIATKSQQEALFGIQHLNC